MIALLFLALAGGALPQAGPPAGDVRAIILRSAERDQQYLEARRDYTFLTRTEQRSLDAAGNVRKVESRTQEVLVLYGRPYRRLIAKDDKPLAPDEDRKEREKMDKEISRRRSESARDREQREQEAGRNLDQQRQILREVADAFDFRLLGQEEVDGFATWVIQAEPRPGYKPRSKQTRMLPSFRGKVWITQDEYRWVKVEAEVIRNISVGLVLARLHPGTTLSFEQRRVHNEIWMPSQVRTRVLARVALLKKYNEEVLVTYSDYRKFRSDSRITEAVELEPETPQ